MGILKGLSDSGAVINPEFQCTNPLYGMNTQASELLWESHFWDKEANFPSGKGSLASPIMVKGRPMWRGAFLIDGDEIKSSDYEVTEILLTDFDLNIYLIPIKLIRLPTDAEYDRYFRDPVENGTYYVQKTKGISNRYIKKDLK